MAEFVEVMNQWVRLCKSFDDCNNGCPLATSSGEPLCATMTDESIKEQCKAAMKFEKVVMNWAKEHPVKTNAMKFEEVFGVKFSDEDPCGLIKCPNSGDCDECKYKNFWQQEYEESEV